MFFSTGEVATGVARHHLERMRDPDGYGITFAKRKLKRPIGERAGGGRVARDESVDTFRKHQSDELSEVAALVGQRCGARGSIDRLWCGPPFRDPEHVRD